MANKLVNEIIDAKIASAIDEAQSFALVEHSGTQGRLREIVLTNLIKPFLPPSWEVTTGFLCSSDGSDSKKDQSGQEDLIVYDPGLLPPFFARLEQAIVPIEAAVATIEVKSTLDRKGVRQASSHSKQIAKMACLWEYKIKKRNSDPFFEQWKRPFHNVFALNTNLTEQGKSEWDRIIEVHKELKIDRPMIHAVCVVGRSTYIHERRKVDFSRLYVAPENQQEVLMWLLSLVDFARLTHNYRTEDMKHLIFSQYFTEYSKG